jgi:NSS family neurotransmitter:Na+ symporter
VGLGNIWRFPYITGENGGGLFVLIYLVCIALVGLPIMLAELVIGRNTQRSPVGAFKSLAGDRSPWVSFGWLGVLTAYVILSFYSVVAGWALRYTYAAIRGTLAGMSGDELGSYFGIVAADGGQSIFWHVVFMAVTALMVMRGVERGLERWSRILMPALIALMVLLLLRALTLEGAAEGLSFVFGLHADELTSRGVLAALGHSFFTLSVGMGAMITYGSYLRKEEDLVKSAVTVAALDTVIALLACALLFPITFTYGMAPSEGPGLIFGSVPVALAQMPFGQLLSVSFFALVVFAAFTSGISLLEVAASYFIDEKGWSRKKATLVTAVTITLVGIPSALSNGASEFFGQRFTEWFGADFFTLFADFSSDYMLPIGGLGIAAFVSWRMKDTVRHHEFFTGTTLGRVYGAWLTVLRFLVPLAIIMVFLNSLGLI